MIISVQFKSKKTGTYGGMKFSYWCNLPVKPGDFVHAPTKYGESIAQVAEIEIEPNRIDDRILAVMKTITAIAEPPAPDPCAQSNRICETCGELTPIGEGDHICGEDPFKMPVSEYQQTEDYLWCGGRKWHSK